MLQFTYSHQPRNMLIVWLCVLAFHAAMLDAVLISAPQMDDSEKSIAMEMLLTPVSNTPTAKSHLQPVLESKAAVTHPEKTAPSPIAPAVQAHAATTSNDAVPATATTASTSRAQAMPALTLPSSEAQGLNNPKPVYPKLSRRLNEQGQVVIRVHVGADGSAQQGEIKTSSGYDRLDQEALRTVLRWRFVPGQRLGTPEAMWFNVPVNFVLE
jgi:periplasmic protein TonB